jgi:hypothetical protein
MNQALMLAQSGPQPLSRRVHGNEPDQRLCS